MPSQLLYQYNTMLLLTYAYYDGETFSRTPCCLRADRLPQFYQSVTVIIVSTRVFRVLCSLYFIVTRWWYFLSFNVFFYVDTLTPQFKPDDKNICSIILTILFKIYLTYNVVNRTFYSLIEI